MSIVEESFRLYWGNSDMWLLYVLSLVLVVFWKKDNRTILVWYAALILFVILNPLFSLVAGRFIDSSTTYVRVYYLLPVIFTIAYACTEVVWQQKKERKKLAVMVVLCLVIAFSGKSYYELGAYRSTENIYKIPEEQREIADYILDDLEEGETADTLVVLWDPNWFYIRQYTGRIAGVGLAMPLKEYRNKDYAAQGDPAGYVTYMQEQGIQFGYMIVDYDADMISDYVEAGHILLGTTENYAAIKVSGK